MDKLFGRKPAPARVPTDRVQPLHFFENSLLVQGNNMAVSLVFDDVLDPEKLRQSLEGLVKREGWQRLGGRLRKNATTGKIEWHIPAEFSAERPVIHFAHVDHGVATSAHPAASKIPAPSTRPAVVADPDDRAELAWEAGYQPNGISDFLTEDRAVLGLRVNSFTDKTIVVLQWQHVAFDALGMQYVVENWVRILHGKDSEVLTPCGTDKDPFDALAQGTRGPYEPHVLNDRRVGLAGMLKWGLGYGVDMLVRAKENRMVCVPKTYWQPQLEKAYAELRTEAIEKGEEPGKVFLTENDVLTAWMLRCIVAPMEMDPNRTVSFAATPITEAVCTNRSGRRLDCHVPSKSVHRGFDSR